MSNVLMTGATGFIGHYVVKASLKNGNNVRALVLPDDTGAAAPKIFAGRLLTRMFPAWWISVPAMCSVRTSRK